MRVWAWRRIMSVTAAAIDVAGPGGVEAVELGRVAEQVGDDVEEPLHLGVVGLEPPHARAALASTAARTSSTPDVRIDAEQPRDAR